MLTRTPMMPKITPRGRLAANLDDEEWEALVTPNGLTARAANPTRSRPRPKKKTDHMLRDEMVLLAVAKKTSTGLELTHTSWIEHEYHTLKTLFDAGADVPRPVARGNSTILMEYVGDVDQPAPLLQDVHLESDEVQPLFDR